MSQPRPEQNAVPEGYDGYVPPAAPPYAGGQYQAGPLPHQPYQAQQPYPPQQEGYPGAPQQQYPPQQQPYPGQQGYPGAPQQQYPGQQPQMQYQMPDPVHGYPRPKSKLVAGLLGIFLGGLGIHRFYLGHTKIGVIQFLLTVVLGTFTGGLVGLWGVIEGIMILTGSTPFRTDARGIPLRR